MADIPPSTPPTATNPAWPHGGAMTTRSLLTPLIATNPVWLHREGMVDTPPSTPPTATNPPWSHAGAMTRLTSSIVQLVTDHGMLPANPDLDEHPRNGFTPRESLAARSTQRVSVQKLEVVCALGDAQASACAQDTRLGMPGQRTGRVRRTQGRAGVQS